MEPIIHKSICLKISRCSYCCHLNIFKFILGTCCCWRVKEITWIKPIRSLFAWLSTFYWAACLKGAVKLVDVAKLTTRSATVPTIPRSHVGKRDLVIVQQCVQIMIDCFPTLSVLTHVNIHFVAFPLPGSISEDETIHMQTSYKLFLLIFLSGQI